MSTTFVAEQPTVRTRPLESFMKALVFRGKNDVRLENVPVPRPGPGEVVIRVTLTTICGTDVHIVFAGVVMRWAFLGTQCFTPRDTRLGQIWEPPALMHSRSRSFWGTPVSRSRRDTSIPAIQPC